MNLPDLEIAGLIHELINIARAQEADGDQREDAQEEDLGPRELLADGLHDIGEARGNELAPLLLVGAGAPPRVVDAG